MNPSNNKRLETIIYVCFWLIAILLFTLDIIQSNGYSGVTHFNHVAIGHLCLTILPLITLFAINNYILIPKLLKKGMYVRYFISALLLIVAIWIWQNFQFFNILDVGRTHPHHIHSHRPGPHPLLPLPLFLDLIYDVLIIGVNLAISLLFQQFADRLQHESLMKENAENQLSYLKAQISPHFYMNMLNNIHGMIEIDPQKAQEMVIEMSSLMRYMLYDSSRSEIALSDEVGFIKDYIALMRVRYPDDIVSISVNLPNDTDIAGIRTPPLLFLVFLENAFKHGISYTSTSFVSVNLTTENGSITFRCSNSLHRAKDDTLHHGIGLKNVKRRLNIIYGNKYNLEITQSTTYNVTLSLPVHETENINN